MLQMHNVGSLTYAHSLNPLYSESLIRKDFYKIDSALNKLKKQSPYFEDVFLMDQKGIVVGTTGQRMRGKDFSAEDYFKNTVQTNQDYVIESVVIKMGVTGYPSAMISSPVVYNGLTIGVITVSMNMEGVR